MRFCLAAAVWLLPALVASECMAAPFAYVTNSGDDSVSVIDTATDQVSTVIPVGPSPYGVAVHPSGDVVYVSNRGDASVSIIDAGRNQVDGAIENAGGFGIATSPDGARLYVVGLRPADQMVLVSVVDTQTRAVITRIPVAARGPGDDELGIVVSPDGAWAYLFTTLDSEQFPCHRGLLGCRLILHTLDLVSNALASSVTVLNLVAGFPRWITLSPSGCSLYVSDDSIDGKMPIISVHDGTPSGFINLGERAFGSAFDDSGQCFFAAGLGTHTLSVIDASNNAVKNAVPVGNGPIGVGTVGDKVYVVNSEDDSVSVVDVGEGAVTTTIGVGRNPIAFGRFIGASPEATRSGLNACVADCNGDGDVTVSELVTSVSIALGLQQIDACPSAACAGRPCVPTPPATPVSIVCLIRGVAAALNGCN